MAGERPPSRKQAQEILERYLKNVPIRIARLQGQAPTDLDFSRESLQPLWDWARGRAVAYADDPAEVGDEVVWRDSEPSSPLALTYWSPKTRLFLDDFATYFGETIVRHIGGIRHALGKDAPRSNVMRRKPVLQWESGFEAAPILQTIVMFGLVDHPGEEADPFTRLFDLYVQDSATHGKGRP